MVEWSDCTGLRALAEEGSFTHRVVVCREPVARQVDGIEILPSADFVERLWSDTLIDLRLWSDTLIDLDSVALG